MSVDLDLGYDLEDQYLQVFPLLKITLESPNLIEVGLDVRCSFGPKGQGLYERTLATLLPYANVSST